MPRSLYKKFTFIASTHVVKEHVMLEEFKKNVVNHLIEANDLEASKA